MAKKTRGYGIYDYDGTGMLEVQKDDSSDLYEDDEAAAMAAARDGIRLIPVEELPENFSRRYLGWVDTPENRERIAKYAREHSREMVKTNIGTVPVEDYREIVAMQNGFESYADMRREGFCLGDGYDTDGLEEEKQDVPESPFNAFPFGTAQEMEDAKKRAEAAIAVMTAGEKYMVYRLLRKESVKEDVLARAEDMGIEVDDATADLAADYYAFDGEYDCNKDYWSNIDAVTQMALGV